MRASRLHNALFALAELSVYAVVDGAALQGLVSRLQADTLTYSCLLDGVVDAELANAAPYLIALEADSPFTQWLTEDCWGLHPGIFALFSENIPLQDVRQHFRQLLKVSGPDDTALYFRFYDPRVLRLFLPMCDAREIPTLFTDRLQYYIMEDDQGQAMLRFHTEQDAVLTTVI